MSEDVALIVGAGGVLAAAKFALRGLTQALAREYQPQGVRVAHVVVDGLLRGSHSVARFGGSETRTIDPRAASASDTRV